MAVIIAAALLLFSISAAIAQNIDTTEPIVRSAPPGLQNSSYFGYSLVLHRIASVTSGSTFLQHVNAARIVVSAPNGTADGANAVERTGLIYSCPITQGSSCQPLNGDNTGADRRLYDTDANPMSGGATTFNKTGQFLGISMDSRDNHFIVCAHRFLQQGGSGTSRLPRGRCYYTSNRDLTNFQEMALCDSLGSNFNYCQLGTSVALAESNNNIDIGFGAPGSFRWRGVLFRRGFDQSVNRLEDGEGTTNNGWQGYALTKGRIISTTREDLITSVPRSRTYLGSVNIISNDPNLDIIDFALHGNQLGEYYGFSLATADLTGDGFDELLVGAPMYSTSNVPEAGRVYVYRNTGGSLSFLKQLTGEAEPYTRFGHAITNLGDINGDNLDDVAISAPFGSGSGKVYIYYGSTADVITNDPVQVIVGSNITANLTGVDTPSGFGTSLSSLDVDGNEVNDLAIGSMYSQQTFLLRSRVVADVSVTLQTNPSIVQTSSGSNTTCVLDSTSYPCFNITVCAMYPNRNTLPSSLSLNFNLNVDRSNNELGLQRRVFFDNPGRTSMMSFSETFSRNVESCVTHTAYIFNTINDIFNGFPVEVSVTGPTFVASSNDGNPLITDITNYPFVSTTGVTRLSVEQFRDCGGQTPENCIPDLQLSLLNVTYESSAGVDRTITNLTAGLVTNFNVWLRLQNNIHSAFLAQINFPIDTSKFEFVRVEPRSLLISCSPQIQAGTTIINCPVASVLNTNESRTFAIRLRPTSGLTGSERFLQFSFNATSVNPENSNTLANNNITTTLTVLAQADVFLDKPIANPEQVSYINANNTNTFNITSLNDLGPQIAVQYVVRNAGPSTIPTTRLSILWPYRPTGSNYYYAYPATTMSSSGSTIACETTFFNPENYTINDGNDDVNEGEGGTTENRRRKRWLGPMQRRSKRALLARQTGGSNNVVEQIEDTRIDCMASRSECVEILCTIFQLPSDGSAELSIISYLDERYFSSQVNRFSFITHAEVSIINSPFIVQPNSHRSDTNFAEFRAVTSTPPPRRGDVQIEAWMIIVPIVLALIFFTVIGIILYFVGFFKRKHKEKKDEIAAQMLGEQQGGEVPVET